jgi:hypothetical protein
MPTRRKAGHALGKRLDFSVAFFGVGAIAALRRQRAEAGVLFFVPSHFGIRWAAAAL